MSGLSSVARGAWEGDRGHERFLRNIYAGFASLNLFWCKGLESQYVIADKVAAVIFGMLGYDADKIYRKKRTLETRVE